MVLPQHTEHKPKAIHSGHSFQCQDITLLCNCSAIESSMQDDHAHSVPQYLSSFWLHIQNLLSHDHRTKKGLSHWKSPVGWHIDHRTVCMHEEEIHPLQSEYLLPVKHLSWRHLNIYIGICQMPRVCYMFSSTLIAEVHCDTCWLNWPNVPESAACEVSTTGWLTG